MPISQASVGDRLTPTLKTSASSGDSAAPLGFGCVRTGKNCGVPTLGSMSSASVVCVPNAWNSDGARNDVPTEPRSENFNDGRHSRVAFGSAESTPSP